MKNKKLLPKWEKLVDVYGCAVIIVFYVFLSFIFTEWLMTV